MSITMEWLMDDTIEDGAGLSLARMTVPVDAVSELHSHPNCAETIHVLVGKIEQRCGDGVVELSEGETFLIHEGLKHQTRNIGTDAAILMVAYSAGSRIYEVS